jgi:ABC-type branched-subunit amino acid transport system substrate-binding protein
MRIGVIADVNTAVNPGEFQKNVNMIKAWASILNANGGLAGRQIQVDFCDSRFDPNTSTNCLIAACQNDFALVGTSALLLTDTSDIDACKNQAGQPAGIPNVAGISFTPQATCDKDSFGWSGNDPTLCTTRNDNPQTYTVLAGDDKWLESQYPGLHGIFVYNTDSPLARAAQVPIYTVDSKNSPIKLDGQGFYGSSCTAPQSALIPAALVIKTHGSTFVQDGSCPANMVQLQAEAKLQGVNTVKAWMCAGACYTPYYIALNPSVTEGTYQNLTTIAFYTEWMDNPTMKAEVEKLNGTSDVTKVVDANAMESYVAALLFQDAVAKTTASGGTLDRATLFNTLRTQETAFNGAGLIGTTNVSQHQPSPCFAVARVVNGTWQRVYPSQALAFDCTPSNIQVIKLNMNS